DLEAQSARGAILLFSVLAAPRVLFGDRAGRMIKRSRLSVLFTDAPRLAFDLISGYVLLIPLSYLLTAILNAALAFRPVAGASADNRPVGSGQKKSYKALVLRATLTSAAEGGMPTHLEGFVRGCSGLGHRLKLLISGRRRDNLPEEALFGLRSELTAVSLIK